MWDQTGQVRPAASGWPDPQQQAEPVAEPVADAGGARSVADLGADVLAQDEIYIPEVPVHGAHVEVGSEAWRRMQARQILREFLRAVPRSETEATVAFLRADGTPRVLTRAQLSTAIDRLRVRQRQIVRLAIEERWPRPRVCEYLRNISLKTLERDQVEALDILATL